MDEWIKTWDWLCKKIQEKEHRNTQEGEGNASVGEHFEKQGTGCKERLGGRPKGQQTVWTKQGQVSRHGGEERHSRTWLSKLGKSCLSGDLVSPGKDKTANASSSCRSLRRWWSTALILLAPLPHCTSPCVWAQTPCLKSPPLQLTCSHRTSQDKIAFLNLTVGEENKLHTENCIRKIFEACMLKGQVKDIQFSQCQNVSGKTEGDGAYWCCSDTACVDLAECYAALEDHLHTFPPDASVDLQLLPRSKENWSKQMRLLQQNVK